MAEVIRSIKDQAAHDAALGILAGIDPQTGAVLMGSLTDDADTGEIIAANGPLLDFSAAVPQEIAGTNLVNETSFDEVLSANTVQENAADSTAAGTATRSDADTGAVLTYSLTGDAGGLFAIHAAGGAISVLDAAPSHSISVRGADQGTLVFDEDFTIAVTDPEEAPVAVGDYVMTNEDTPLVFAASALTGNDSDPDGDALTVTAVGNATHGTVLLLDGNITFTPDANFSGIAQFDYTASDGRGGSTTATVTVDVAPVADAPSLQATQFMHAVRKSAGEFLVNTATFNGQLNPSVTALTNALQDLIGDVKSGRADFECILVYDVSRWGGFQDADESAYYEFICKEAGVQVHYCAELFENDGSLTATILKNLKRAMAGEFSRELSVKVFMGQSRITRMGFWRGGAPGLAPGIATNFGVSAVTMVLPMQLMAGMGRAISPVSGVIIAVSKAGECLPFEIVGRTILPSIGGMVTMLLINYFRNG
jgi:hypothetical protein